MKKTFYLFLAVAWLLLGCLIGISQADPSGNGNCIAVSAGGNFSLALLSDGTVRAWGGNKNGQLGNGGRVDSYLPAPVSGLTGVKAIAAGDSFGLALKNDGTVWAWGDNYCGQLGNDSNIDGNIPVRVKDLTGVTAIAAGFQHSVALRNDGTVWVWGSDDVGQLGDDEGDSYLPIRIANLDQVVAIAATFNHTLALKRDGAVWSWGWDFTGELGQGGPDTDDFDAFGPPGPVKNLTGIIAIAAGGSHSLALRSDGAVWAWGNNGFGQLGINQNVQLTRLPVQVTGLTEVAGIAAGGEHSVAVRRDGTVWVWGNNYDNQLDRTDLKESGIPLPVGGLSNVKAVSAADHTLVLKSDGTVWGWGANETGQVGKINGKISRLAQANGL